MPDTLASPMVRRAASIRTKRRRDWSCNRVRQYVLEAWNSPQVFSHQQVCALVMLPCIELFAMDTADVIVMLVRIEDYTLDPEVQELSTHYFEFELKNKITVLITIKSRNTPRKDKEAK